MVRVGDNSAILTQTMRNTHSPSGCFPLGKLSALRKPWIGFTLYKTAFRLKDTVQIIGFAWSCVMSKLSCISMWPQFMHQCEHLESWVNRFAQNGCSLDWGRAILWEWDKAGFSQGFCNDETQNLHYYILVYTMPTLLSTNRYVVNRIIANLVIAEDEATDFNSAF